MFKDYFQRNELNTFKTYLVIDMQIEAKKREIVIKTIELIHSSEGKEITTRRIAQHAQINPAMVNYYFGSKDNLLKAAISAINKDNPLEITISHEGTRKAMFNHLLGMCETSLQYSKLGMGRDAVSLASDAMGTSTRITEMKKLYDGNTSTGQDKNSVLRAVSFLLTTTADPEGFASFSGIDVRIKSQLKVLISEQLDILLGESL